MESLKQIIRSLSSIKVAVITILALIVVFAWGTFVESRYDARTAQNLVYHTTFTYLTMALLVINLLFSMFTKLPWKKRHIPFLLAHIGIILIVASAYADRIFGLDASMSLEMGKSKNWVITEDTYINVYQSHDGKLFLPNKLAGKKVNFFANPPEKNHLSIPVVNDHILVTDFYAYATANREFKTSNASFAGPAIRFVLQNQFVTHSDWLVHSDDSVSFKKIGPLSVYLNAQGVEDVDEPTIVFNSIDNKTLGYAMLDKKVRKIGKIKPGMSVQTPWMDMKLMMLKYLPKAVETFSYTLKKNPSDVTTEAVQIKFQNQSQWVRLNSYAKFEYEDGIYLVSYTNDQIGIGFDMKLNNFTVETYPGGRASEYRSDIEVEGKNYVISMNEPFKKNGLTFYQASYQENEEGRPVISILQVNHDPARQIKYFGAILLSLGTAMMFYKRKA